YNEAVKEVFDENGIEIPFPHLTLYMGQDKDGSAPPMHMVRDDRPADRPGGTAGSAPSPAPAPAPSPADTAPVSRAGPDRDAEPEGAR
ncbi:MAG: mechanosensitive ion channel family protein, partial [Azospirillaceae bacterium]